MKSLSRNIVNLKAEYDLEQKNIIEQALVIAMTYCGALKEISDIVAELDCLVSLAHIAGKFDKCEILFKM